MFLGPPAETGHLIMNLRCHVLNYACLWREHMDCPKANTKY